MWRGFVYTILMLLAKLCTGLWLVRLNISSPEVRAPVVILKLLQKLAGCLATGGNGQNYRATSKKTGTAHEMSLVTNNSQTPANANIVQHGGTTSHTTLSADALRRTKISKSLSLYPASMLGTAMTARGEIGFLIASVAASTGLFDSSTSTDQPVNGTSEIYLVVIWAVVLCTVIGPLSIGSLVRRVKRLERKTGKGRRVDGPLGIWGLDPGIKDGVLQA